MDCKQVCFNELSLTPLCTDKQEAEVRIRQYVEVLKCLYQQKGIKKVRYHENLVNIGLTEEMSLQDFCNLHPKEPLSILLLSTFTMPQVDENDESALEQYCDTKIDVYKDGEPQEADGFNAAYCQGTFCIGFRSEEFWANCLFPICIHGAAEKIQWACLSQTEHVTDPGFLDWYAATLQSISLEECETEYQEKLRSIHLRDDHGKDVLEEHAKKLLHSPYVKSIINSLPFNSNTTRYIWQIKENGIINIVLHWTDNGYGMAIQTTGRNIRETQAIGKIIEEKYGHK